MTFEMLPTASELGRHITIVIWNVSLLSISIYKFYFNQTQAVNKLMICVLLTMLTAMFLSSVSVIVSYFAIHEIHYAYYILVLIVNISMYLLVLLRLRRSFIGSQFSISTKKIYFHISLITLAVSCSITGYILDYLLLYPWNFCFFLFAASIYIIGYCHLT